MDVKLAVLVLIAIGLTHEGDCLNLDRHVRRQEIGELKDGLLGAIRKASTPLLRRDLRSERLKTKCNLCRIHDKCKRLGKCEECEEPCEQYQQSLQPTAPKPTNPNAKKPTEFVALSQRTSTSSEDGLSENEDRYFTLGAFPQGAVQSLLRRLLGIKEPEGRMVVMVQPNSPKDQKKQPVIIDTAHVFTLNEGIPRKVDVEMHDVGKINEDAGELVTKLNRNIDEALNAKPKNEEPRLSPEEVDRIIASTIDTSNLFMNSRSMAPEDENLIKLPGATIDADGKLLSSGNVLPADQSPIKKRPGVIDANDNEEEVGCSKEEEDDDYYRSANEQDSNPKRHPDPYQAEDKIKLVDNHLSEDMQSPKHRHADESNLKHPKNLSVGNKEFKPVEEDLAQEPPKNDVKNADDDKGKPVENHLEEDKSPINRNADVDTPNKDDQSGNDDKGQPINNDLENKELQNDEPEVLFIENSPVPKPVSDNQIGISNPGSSLPGPRSAEYMQQPIVQPESTYNYRQQIPQNEYDVPQAQQPEYSQPEVFEGPQANYQQFPSPPPQYGPPQANYNAPQAAYQTSAAPSNGYSFVPQSQNPTQYEPIVEPIDISANSMEIMPGNLVNDNASNDKYLVASPEAPLPLKDGTELKGRDSADGLREDGTGTMHAPKIQMKKTTIDKVISTPSNDKPEVTIHDKSEIPPEDAFRSSSWQQRDSGNVESHREDGRGTMHAPKVQPQKTTIEKVISTPSEEGSASLPEQPETPDRPPEDTTRTLSSLQRDSENTEGHREGGRAKAPKAPKVQPKRTDIKQIITTPTDEIPPQLPHLKNPEQSDVLKPTVMDVTPDGQVDVSPETTQETVGDAIAKLDNDTEAADKSYTRKIDPPKIQNTKNSAIDKIITTPDGDTQKEVPPENVVESSWKQRSGHWRNTEQGEVPPLNTHDQHPTETPAQPEIPEEVVGNAQFDDALRRLDMLRFNSNAEERADSSNNSHPTIKPVIPLFNPMRLPPRGVGLVPEPNKNELEMNLRQPTPSMDDDKIVDTVSGIVDDATLSATHINHQLMDIVNDKISQPLKSNNLLSVIPDIKTTYPTRNPIQPINLKQESPSIEKNEQKEALLLPETKEVVTDMNLGQSESTNETENSEDEEVGCKKEKKKYKKMDYYMNLDPIPSYGGNDYGHDDYRSATDEDELQPLLPPLNLLPAMNESPLLPTLQDLFKPRSHHEPREPNRNHPHRQQPQNHHSSHHNKRPSNVDHQQPNNHQFAPRQFQEDENQIISSPFNTVNNGYNGYHHLGRLVPWDHKIQKRDLAEQIRQRNMFFNGDGIKLPLSLKEYKDGSLHLSIDVKSLCNCKHCNGEQSHDPTAFIEPVVGDTKKIDEVDLEIPAQNDEKVEFAPNNLKELLEMGEAPQMEKKTTELRKRSIFDNRIEKIRGDDGETIVLPIQKFNRNNLFNTDPMTEMNSIENERTMSPEKFNLLRSFLNLMKNLVTNDIDIR